MSEKGPIVSLLSSATEILYALGLGERVVGVSHECDYPADVFTKPRVTRSNIDSSLNSREIDERVKSRLAADQPLYEIDVAALIQMRPKLIVTQAKCDVCAVRFEDVSAAVQNEPALRTTQIVALNPRSLLDVLRDIERVADAAGVSLVGKDVVARYRQRIRNVEALTKDLPTSKRPRVACIEWTDPLMLAANWMPELVRLAGGTYNLDETGAPSEYSAWHDLIHFDPQVIVVMPCGFDLDRSIAEAHALAQRPGWERLDAVCSNRVFAVDASAYFNRSGPRLVESLELLAHLLHPDLLAPPAIEDHQRAHYHVKQSKVC
jgi:iron complex transport system substrate-binding protein